MKKKFLIFVHEFKEILAMKQESDIKLSKMVLFKNAIISTVILLIIFIVIGSLFQTIENLNFVFLATNTVILGSFLLNRYSYEVKYQIEARIKYNIFVSLIYETLVLLFIILFSNSIFLLLFFNKVISIILMIIILIISIIIRVIIIKIEDFVVNKKKFKNNIFLTSLVVLILYISLLYILDIKSISLTYIISTFIICMIALYKYIMKPDIIYTLYTPWSLMSFLIFGFIMVSLTQWIMKDDLSPYPTSMLTYEANIEKKLDLDLSEPIDNIEFTESKVYVFTEKDIYLYNRDFIFESKIRIELSTDIFYFSVGELMMLRYSPELGSNPLDKKPYRLYKYNENNEKEEVMQLFYEKGDLTFAYPFYFEGHYSVPTLSGIDKYEYLDDYNIYGYLFDYETVNTLSFDTTPIIYQDDEYVIYIKDGFIDDAYGRNPILTEIQSNVFYSNGYFYNLKRNSLLTTFDISTAEKYSKKVILNGKVESDDILLFEAHNNLFYVVYKLTDNLYHSVLVVYNTQGEEVGRLYDYGNDINITDDTPNRFYDYGRGINITDNILITWSEDSSVVTFINPEDISHYCLSVDDNLSFNLGFMFLVGFIILFDIPVFLLDRREMLQ